MGSLTRLDRALDRSQHLLRENASNPPAVLQQMLADTLDAHGHQLPDAPPPPKLPPPPLNPPLSLELLPPEDPPQDAPLDPPDHPPLPRGVAAVMPSLSIVKTNAMTPAIPERISDPKINHATIPTRPPVATEPISLPSRVRRNAPPTKMPNRTSGLNSKSRCS